MNGRWLNAIVLIVVFGGVAFVQGQERREPWDAPPLERSISIRDGRTDQVIPLPVWLDRLAKADVVFLGEQHTDETTHRVELAVYEGLLERRQGLVTLAMEMFERDVQPTLDAYLKGEIPEKEFLEKSRPWGNYRTAYRPLIERAKTSRSPVVASNFPMPLRRRMAMEGPDILKSLEGDARRQAPEKLLAAPDNYWRRVENATRGHPGMGGEDDRLHSTQSLWDNSMGEACAIAIDRYPGRSVLHINGDFHSTYWSGTVHQLRQRKPKAKIKTVSIVPVSHPGTAELRGEPVADYVVFVEARASDVDEGAWSVHTSRESRYQFHLPRTATADAPAPLLIWLVEDGLRAADGLELWRERLGEDAAIAVLEPPYLESQDDLGVGGRWFWNETFSSDVGTTGEAVDHIWGYLARHFPIDPKRIVVAGEGTGGTVAAATALLSDRLDVFGLARNPRQYARIKDFPLPLPEDWGKEAPPKRTIAILGTAQDGKWWEPELQAYQEVGVATKLITNDPDPWKQEWQFESVLREGLGLPSLAVAPTQDRRYLLVESDSPRARHWARMQALWSSDRDGGDIVAVSQPPEDRSIPSISTAIQAENFAVEEALPRCPGPFGGTTVLVLPPTATEQEVKAWLSLQDNDPLAKRSRFHRMRVATSQGELSLPQVLEKLQSENRKNVLIVPAVFYADPAWLRDLRRSVRDQSDQMTLQWSPGLGSSKAALSPPDPAAEPPLQHQLSVTFKPDTHQLVVRDRVQLPPSLRREGTTFTLHSRLKIDSSNVPINKGDVDPTTQQTRYTLSKPPADGGLELSFAGEMNFGLSEQKEEYTRGFRETQGILGPAGVYLDGGSHWVPQFEDRLIRFTLELELPQGWHVISQGKGTSRDEQGRAHWEAEGPMEEVYLVGGPLHRVQDTAGSVEVLVYLHEPDDALSRKYLDTGARYLEMYRSLIGPYPYSKFALVENFWESGYGMPSFTLLGPQVIRFPFILHSSYPHEILHNWWGNSVFVDPRLGNWCEGLTAYMADHLIEEQRGQGTEYRRNTLQKYRNYVRNERDFPLSDFRARHSAATEAVGYGKALMTFHMLRRRLGDEAFKSGLASFYRQYRGKRAGYPELRAVFDSTAETKLDFFFDQWIRRSGAPQLALRDVSVTADGEEFVIRGILEQLQSADPFELDVPVVVQTAMGTKTETVRFNSRQHPLEIRASDRPMAVTVDPLFDVFRLLDPRETPPSIGQIFGQPKVLAILPSAADAATQSRYRELLSAWGSDDHEVSFILDRELAELPDDRPVWILGRDNRYQNQIAANDSHVRLDDSGEVVTLAGERVPFAGHCIVAVRRHPKNLEQAIGWLVVDPADAFAGMARKLPHYGKYSYLAFEGTEPTNTVKGQWSTSGSPLTVDLRGDRSTSLPTLALESRRALAELPPVFSSRALMAHVEWLAAPEREGRGLGSQGLEQSAEYIAKAMSDAGLRPGGDQGTWFQEFTVEKGPQGRPVKTRNVVGVLPGRREDWKTQSVILGAHYDHLGSGWPDVHQGDEGKLHPGADDNASGIAILLEMARVVASQEGGPRNLVFVAFSAEECGLHGSRHYVAHPTFPADEIRAVINMDTVGRLFNQQLSVLGTGTADEWQHIFRGCTFVTGVPSKNIADNAGGSDQLSFIESGIPAVQIFSGAHGDYHRPGDTTDKIDVNGLVKVATFVKEAVEYLIEREPPLTVRTKAGGAPAAPAGDGGRKVLFGAVPAFDFQGPGVKFDSLVPDSPAARAGLKPGDVLVRIDNVDIADLPAFSNHLKKLEAGQTVNATVVRDGRRTTVPVKLEKR